MLDKDKQLLDEFLERYGEVLGNAGCNDYILQDTPENRALVERVNAWLVIADPQEPPLIEFRNGSAITFDFLILGYLKSEALK